MSDRRTRSTARLASLAAAVAALAAAPSAQAWDASISMPSLGSDFLVGSWSGSWTWETQREGISAELGASGSIPIEYQYQDWDGSAWTETWFQKETFAPAGGSTAAWMDHGDAELPIADAAEAYVTGDLGTATAGSQFAYDFVFTLNPFSVATLQVWDDAAYAYVSSEPGESGIAFAGLKLYDWTADLDVPGGANQAYFNGFVSVATPGGSAEQMLNGLEHTFSNMTAAPVSWSLRLEGYALVFTTPVPEPSTPAMLLAGLVGVGAFLRRRMVPARA